MVQEPNTNGTKSRLVIYLPILLALMLVAGMFIGARLSFFQKRGSGQNNRSFLSIKFDNYDKLNDIINYINESYVDSVNKDELIEETIVSMLQTLDPHSNYISAVEFKSMNEPLEGSFDGIGVEFNIQRDTIVVINPIVGGPSEKVGILAGDRIVKVDDSLVAGVNIGTSEVMKLLKGKKGTKVALSVYRRGKEDLLDFTIIRDKIPSHSLDIAYMVDGKTGYIKLSRFSATTHEEFVEAVENLQKEGMEKLVLDLRGNGGGYLDAAINISDEFLEPKKLIVYTDGRKRPKNYAYARRNGVFQDQPVAVLIDEWSASASEIVAGAIQDNDRGLIVGRRSFGKGLVQEQIQLLDGSALRLTVARYYTPSGRCIQKPYDNDVEKYYSEFMERYFDGQLENADSIHFNDSLKYTTASGRAVYGGGGIMPDVFVPLQKAERSEYFNELINRGLIYQFAFDYTDTHRAAIKEYKDAVRYTKNFRITDAIFNEFVAYAKKAGVQPDNEGIKSSGSLIKMQMKAYIGRNIFGNDAFYPTLHQYDDALQKAIEAVSSEDYMGLLLPKETKK